MATAKARLTSFRLLAYRSCKDTALKLDNNVTALIGPNGSGKTNLLQGILLLGRATRRRRPSDGDEIYTSKCRIEARFTFRKKTVRYRASFTYRPTNNNRDEVVVADEKWNFKEIDGNAKWISDETIELGFRARREGFLYVPVSVRQHSVRQQKRYLVRTIDRLKDNQGTGKIGALTKREFSAFEAIQKLREAITYYSASQFTNPSLCPTSFDIDEDGDLITEGIVTRRLTHTRFIYDLYRLSKSDKRSYELFLSLADDRGVGLINKLKWRDVTFSSPAYEVQAGGKVITKRRKRVMIIPTIHVGSSQLSFNQLSEGTLRTLAMLFYIVTDKSELLLLEEPEVCVHHGLLRSVIEVIKQYGQSKQILFSTHSETVVDSLNPEQVLLVNKHPARGTIVRTISSSMSRMSYSALKRFLASSGSLGEYWRHSGFRE